MRRVCTGTPVHREQTVWEPVSCGECVRPHRYTVSKQSWSLWRAASV